MAEKKQYMKYGLVTGAGLLALTAALFSTDVWRGNQRESPHYRQDACGVCHLGEPKNAVLKSDEISLCTSCHEPDTHGLVEVPNAEGRKVKVDIGMSHPYGIRADKSWPLTLPVFMGYITCQTCHDVHLTNIESSMLRLGKRSDITPLCHDCHPNY